MTRNHFYVYQKEENKWTWYLRADNGKIIAHGQPVGRKFDALKSIEKIKELVNSPIRIEE